MKLRNSLAGIALAISLVCVSAAIASTTAPTVQFEPIAGSYPPTVSGSSTALVTRVTKPAKHSVTLSESSNHVKAKRTMRLKMHATVVFKCGSQGNRRVTGTDVYKSIVRGHTYRIQVPGVSANCGTLALRHYFLAVAAIPTTTHYSVGSEAIYHKW